MKNILRSKAFWVCVFFMVVALVSRCVFDTSGLPMGVKISSSKPSNGCRNAAYSFQFTADGGTTPCFWSVSWGTKPPGLEIDQNTGELSGTPTQNGTYQFTVQVHDSSGGNLSNYRENVIISIKDFNITNGDTEAIYCPGIPFEYQFKTCGGTGTLTWKTQNGSPPSGISIGSDGKLSGTTTATGSYSFTVVVSDSGGATPAEKAFSLSPATTIQIASSLTLPSGQMSKVYSPYKLEACGGSGSYTWTDVNTDIPQGLKLSSSGLITGTPTQAGTKTFLVKAQDAASPSNYDSETFTIKVVSSALAIATTSPLPNASECVYYSTTLTGSGGTGSYSWKFATGSQKPSWLSLTSLGVLSGTPTTSTSTPYSLTIELSDGKTTPPPNKTFSLSVIEYPAVTAALIIPEIRHAATAAYNVISLTNTNMVKVDFRFTTASYLQNVLTPATLQVIGVCSTISTMDFIGPQHLNSDGYQEIAARFDPSQVAALLTSAGKAVGDSVTLRFTVKVKIDTTTQTFVQKRTVLVGK